MSRATSHRLRDSPCRDQRPRSIPPNGPVHFYPVGFIMKLDNHQINGTEGHDWNKTDKLFIWLVIAGPALRQNHRGSLPARPCAGPTVIFFFSKNLFLLLPPTRFPRGEWGTGVSGFSQKRRFLNLFFSSRRCVSLPLWTKSRSLIIGVCSF